MTLYPCQTCGLAHPNQEAQESTELGQLIETICKLPRDERRVMQVVADRLLGPGLRDYGPLSIATDPRDWGQEAEEEAADLAVYGAIGVLRRRMKGANEDE